MPEIPPEAVQAACPCICHLDTLGVLHTRACCPAWVGNLDGPAGQSLPHIAERIARLLAAEKTPCPDHPVPWLPRPSCWTCGRNGMVHRLTRIAREAFPPEGEATPAQPSEVTPETHMVAVSARDLRLIVDEHEEISRPLFGSAYGTSLRGRLRAALDGQPVNAAPPEVLGPLNARLTLAEAKVRDYEDELASLRLRAERAEAALTFSNKALRGAQDAIGRIRELHQPTEGTGYDCDEDDTPGSYGHIARVCTSCGTSGEYGVRWPCPTAQAIGEEP